MTQFEKEAIENSGNEFVEKMQDKGNVIPEISEIVDKSLSDEEKVNGKFVALYSLKTKLDDEDFYFAPFVSMSENDMKYNISCCNDYNMLIIQLGYYDVCSGKLFTDYKELGTVHQFFMEHSDKYREITQLFGNITCDEIPSIYSNVCEMIIENNKSDKNKLNEYIEFLKSNHIYVPDIKSNDKRVLKRMFQIMKEFVTP